MSRFLSVAFISILFATPVKADPIEDFFALFDQPVASHQRHHRGQTHESYGGGSSVRASFYGHGERLSRHTASGAVFNPHALTAAHRSYPFGTRLLVSYGSRSVVVTVNDRGPAAYTGRSLDLSYGAARALGFGGTGIVSVSRVE